mgnify:CR=1 FL=1
MTSTCSDAALLSGVAGLSPRRLAVRAGHYYAVGVMGHLGVLDDGGLLRIGFVQYTSLGDVDRTLAALAEIAGARSA